MIETNASFSDGRTTERREVHARIEGDRLLITDGDGSKLAAWRIGDLELIDRVGRNNDARLTVRPSRLPRLILRNQAATDVLLARRPELKRSVRIINLKGFMAATIAAAAIVAAIVGMPWLSSYAIVLVPLQFEQRIGDELQREMAPFVSNAKERCDAADGVAALSRLVHELKVAAGMAQSTEVLVLESDAENAFALPGGRIIVANTLIEQMQSPDELSGMLAHELGHVAKRHGIQTYFENAGLGAILSLLLGGGAPARIGRSSEGYLIQLTYSRRQEEEADRIALDTLAKAGLAAHGLVTFFERAAWTWTPTYLSTHPSPESRARMFAVAERGGQHALTPSEWIAVRDICSQKNPAEPPP